MKPDSRVVTGRENDAEEWWPTSDQDLQLAQGLGRLQFVEVIDDEDNWRIERTQCGQQMRDERRSRRSPASA